jgi:hypothetical protein
MHCYHYCIAFRYKLKILLQPFQLFFREIADVLMTGTDKEDIVKYYVVYVSPVKGIIGRPKK